MKYSSPTGQKTEFFFVLFFNSYYIHSSTCQMVIKKSQSRVVRGMMVGGGCNNGSTLCLILRAQFEMAATFRLALVFENLGYFYRLLIHFIYHLF